MTKQAIIAIIIVLSWMILGIFNIIQSNIMFTGLIGYMLGTYLTTWENKDVKKGQGVK